MSMPLREHRPSLPKAKGLAERKALGVLKRKEDNLQSLHPFPIKFLLEQPFREIDESSELESFDPVLTSDLLDSFIDRALHSDTNHNFPPSGYAFTAAE